MLNNESKRIERVEEYLQAKILPELEKSRPNFDRPHTLAVVTKIKEIIQGSPQIEVDKIVLLIAAYAHDWGYFGLFRDGQILKMDDVQQAKSEHMRLGAKKISKLLEDKLFSFLTERQKKRCAHLVLVHDNLKALKDLDELILMEADTLGGLDTSLIKPTFDFESNRRYIKGVKKKRGPLFITDYGKKELPRLIKMRIDYYKDKKRENTIKQLDLIKKAYDQTVDRYQKEISDLDLLPEEFKNSLEFKKFQQTKHSCNSGAPDIKKYLNPKPGMKFLDVGAGVNLVNYALYKWPSDYYGIDISPKLVRATRKWLKGKDVEIGGLFAADVARLPFTDNFFDIAAIIGVLEYYDLGYIKKALFELHRVLKPGGRMVVDMPSLKHPQIQTMIKLESYLGRPRLNLPTRKQFEGKLNNLFSVDTIKDDSLMIKYFVQTKK
ncbi:MAG TPA: class I SAM-dependent methyltransferase [Candidatus Bathyarchaeia archaeon]|nr:class I SAM-dependent methyltransferase [Candidatus Bathyarchaeia archaeon]